MDGKPLCETWLSRFRGAPEQGEHAIDTLEPFVVFDLTSPGVVRETRARSREARKLARSR